MIEATLSTLPFKPLYHAKARYFQKSRYFWPETDTLGGADSGFSISSGSLEGVNRQGVN